MLNHKKSFLILILCLPILLIGCLNMDLNFMTDVNLEVHPNGSGLVGFAFGADRQSKALLRGEGFDFMGLISQSMNQEMDENELNVVTWDDGQYEWTRITHEFDSLAQLNQDLNAAEIFSSFSLQKKWGIFQHTFILEGELAPLVESLAEVEGGIFIFASMIEPTFTLKLPGEIETTNGIIRYGTDESVVWNVRADELVTVYARSVIRNRVGTGAVLLLVGLMVVGGGVLIFGLIGLLVVKAKRANKAQTN